MTRLANASRAEVAQDKIVRYLLNPHNSANKGKSALFERLGFSVTDWEVLGSSLRLHGQVNAVAKTEHSIYGVKHVVRCNLRTPTGEDPCMTTVWIFDLGSEVPRLMTAY